MQIYIQIYVQGYARFFFLEVSNWVQFQFIRKSWYTYEDLSLYIYVGHPWIIPLGRARGQNA